MLGLKVARWLHLCPQLAAAHSRAQDDDRRGIVKHALQVAGQGRGRQGQPGMPSTLVLAHASPVLCSSALNCLHLPAPAARRASSSSRHGKAPAELSKPAPPAHLPKHHRVEQREAVLRDDLERRHAVGGRQDRPQRQAVLHGTEAAAAVQLGADLPRRAAQAAAAPAALLSPRTPAQPQAASPLRRRTPKLRYERRKSQRPSAMMAKQT